ncbi:hypothetical protein L1049_014765 [Liquidambar formosana]|uniref:Uncharacterized protein n=1 Tax=Liquidambar formosana TaxID=63359 RepID=A0AAP0RWY9_LIQFO
MIDLDAEREFDIWLLVDNLEFAIALTIEIGSDGSEDITGISMYLEWDMHAGFKFMGFLFSTQQSYVILVAGTFKGDIYILQEWKAPSQ